MDKELVRRLVLLNLLNKIIVEKLEILGGKNGGNQREIKANSSISSGN